MPGTIGAVELRALGCVVVRDTVVDTMRQLVRAPQRIPAEHLPELAERWHAVDAARRAWPTIGDDLRDRGSENMDAVGAPLAGFVHALVAAAPGLYAPAALRARAVQKLAQACVGCAGVIVFAGGSGPWADLAGKVAFILVLMSLWSLAVSFQLWRSYRVVAAASALAPANPLDRDSSAVSAVHDARASPQRAGNSMRPSSDT
jgi:hypothetical protein